MIVQVGFGGASFAGAMSAFGIEGGTDPDSAAAADTRKTRLYSQKEISDYEYI